MAPLSLQQVLLLCLSLLLGLSASAAALPAMERVRLQVDRVNRRGPSLGLVMSYVDEDTALQASGYFKPWRPLPFIDLYGKLSFSRSLKSLLPCHSLPSSLFCFQPAPISTTSLVFQLNAAVTVQTLIDVFTVSGIVHYGTAGSSNDSMSFGNVSVPKLVAYTGAWTWKTTTSPGVPVIVFRGVSDLAGGEPTWSSTSLMNLASINALKVAVEFIATVGKQKSTVSVQRSNN